MGVNKVEYGNSTILDISNDTVTADRLLQGYTAHDNSGSPIVGTVSFSTIYYGSEDPASSLGKDGDIYLKVVG
jgi:hypothetical protein